jgi:hypothetical protein
MRHQTFPAHLELLTTENAAELRMRGSMYDHPSEYIASLFAKYECSDVYSRTFSMVGTLFGPYRGVKDNMELREAKRAFLIGNLLGTEVIDLTGGEELVDRLVSVNIEFNDIDDNLPAERQLQKAAKQLQKSGQAAYKRAKVLHPLIDVWGIKIVDRDRLQTLRAGLGMVLNLGEAAIDVYEYTALQAEADKADISWDAEFIREFGQ